MFAGMPAQRRTRERVGEPVAGIPSADDARRVMARVLLRVVMLAGLVVCGWLLGSATALASESAPHQVTPATGLITNPSPDGASGDRLALVPAVTTTVDDVLAATDPGAEVSRPPAQPPLVPGLVSQVVHPVLDPVLASAGQPGPSPANTAAEPATTAPTTSTPAVVQVPQAPLPQVGVPVPAAPPPSGSATADPTASPFASPSAAHRDRVHHDPAHSDQAPAPWGPPVPASPPSTSTTSCPAGANTAAPSAQAGTLTDGVARADLALAQQPRHTGAGGLPRSPSRQPSTSPD